MSTTKKAAKTVATMILVEGADDDKEGVKIERQGFMVKRGGRVKTWKRRWFVLRNNELVYYKNSKCEPPPLGSIPIDGTWITESCSHGKHPYAFKLMSLKAASRKRPVVQMSRESTDERVYICSCGSDSDRDGWLKVINAAIMRSRNSDGMLAASGGFEAGFLTVGKQPKSDAPKKRERRIPSSPQIVIQAPSEICAEDHAARMASLPEFDDVGDDVDDDVDDGVDDDLQHDGDFVSSQVVPPDDANAPFWNESESESDDEVQANGGPHE